MPPKKKNKTEGVGERAAAPPSVEQGPVDNAPHSALPRLQALSEAVQAADAASAAPPCAADANRYRAALEALLPFLLQGCEIQASRPLLAAAEKERATGDAPPAAPTATLVTRFSLHEVELYCNHTGLHPDAYTHGSDEQRGVGSWYFHKSGGTFKGGSYKGLDVTAGYAGAPIGVLLRAVRVVDQWTVPAAAGAAPVRTPPANNNSAMGPLGTATVGTVIEGPSLTADAMLGHTGFASIVALVGSPDGTVRVNDERLALVLTPQARRTANDAASLLRGPRVGLVPRRADHLRFVARPYRVVLQPRGAKPLAKMRAGLVASLIAKPVAAAGDGNGQQAPSDDDVIAATGAAAKSVGQVRERIAAAQRAGATPESLKLLPCDVTKAECIAALVGYCTAKGFV